jgi:rubrerythrin
MSEDPTRRALIKRGLVVVKAHGDIAVLRALVALERLVVLGYQSQLSARVLGAEAERVVEAFLGHEQEHVTAIVAELQRIGGMVPAAPSDTTLGKPGSRADALRSLIALERDALGSYYRAMGKIHDPQAALVVAQIMANEGQHACELASMLDAGEPRLITPSAFLYGS